VFWQRGFEATSIDDLVRATGIQRGSLYATFGNKEQLFLAALDRYWEQVAGPMMSALNDPNPRHAMRRMFESIVSRTQDSRLPRGCFFTNSALECPTASDRIVRRISEGMSLQETAIYRVLRRAQTQGALKPHQDARALARLFLAIAQGMNVVYKATGDTIILKDIVDAAMELWKPKESRRLAERRPYR
jgi:TetR/AcrR family transcriptional repressor of nem operon